MAILKPDLEEARRFLKILDPYANSYSLFEDIADGFSFQCFDDSKKRKDARLARVINSTLDSASSKLAELNGFGAGVFVTINRTDMTGRKLENIIAIRAVWVEDDEGLGIKTPLEPHLVTETSPGKFHKIFLVNGLTPVQHQEIQSVLVNQYGCDPSARDVARVLRLAGFWHLKKEPFQVRIIHESGQPPYTASQIIDAFKVDPDAPVVKPTRSPPIAKIHPPTTGTPEYEPISEFDSQLPLPDINVGNAKKYLPIAGDQSYAQWRDVGLALHHQFEGGEEGLTLFDEWSKDVREYQGFEDVEKAWGSFGKRSSGAVVTFKSLIQSHAVAERKKKAVDGAYAYEKSKILLENCDDAIALIGEIAPKLNRLCQGNILLENDLLTALITRHGELRPGAVLSASDAKKAFKKAPARKDTKTSMIGETSIEFNYGDTPEWAVMWVWVSEEEVFYNPKNRSRLTQSGFRGHHDSYLPLGENAPKDSAKWLRDNNLIPKVMRSMYAPRFNEIFFYDGVSYVNTFSSSYRCEVPDEIKNHAAVDIFRKHLDLFFGGFTREAQIFCNFLKCCCDLKPRFVRWSPLLIGIPGDGKSMYYTLVARALGIDNTRLINAASIISSASSGQTGWAEGHCFGAIEEIKLHGHNRNDVMNALKPYITNDVVSIKKMYQEVRNAPNAANYMMFTNYLDGVPIEKGDRRLFVVQGRLNHTQVLDSDHFDAWADAIQNHPGDIICWLRSVPEHPDFKPDGHAPMTDTKLDVIKLTSDEMVEIVTNILEDVTDEPMYCTEVICFDELLRRIVAESGGSIKLEHDYKLGKALTQLGYVKLDRVRVFKERHRVWAKRADGVKPTEEWAKHRLESRLKSLTDTDSLF